MSLIFLRHPEPEIESGTCYGRTDLSLLDNLDTTVSQLNAELPSFDAIVTSPLSRCKSVAEALAAQRRVSVSIEPDIIEIDFGTWEMRNWDDLARAEIDAWAKDVLNARSHGGESVAMARTRVQAALRKPRPGPTLWVSHSGVFKCLMDITQSGDPWTASLGFGEFTVFDV